jgi:hypothetical protein
VTAGAALEDRGILLKIAVRKPTDPHTQAKESLSEMPRTKAPSKKSDTTRPVAAAFPASADAASEQTMFEMPVEHVIRMRAYELFLQRGGGHGHDQDDWLAAERELLVRR